MEYRFKKISEELMKGTDITVFVYYDTITKVMYQIVGTDGIGGLSVMYNADGSVMLYED